MEFDDMVRLLKWNSKQEHMYKCKDGAIVNEMFDRVNVPLE
jgi:hypothetical protein